MNERQEELLATYRDQWTRLNMLNALRAEVDAEVRALHSRQRQLANKIAALGALPGEGEPTEGESES